MSAPLEICLFSVVVVFYVYNATAKMLRTPQSHLFPVLIGGPSEITLPSAWDRNLRRHRTGCLVSQVLHQQDEALAGDGPLKPCVVDCEELMIPFSLHCGSGEHSAFGVLLSSSIFLSWVLYPTNYYTMGFTNLQPDNSTITARLCGV